MRYILFIAMVSLTSVFNMKTIYDFDETSRINEWQIINDGVMGGVSEGNIHLNELGNGVFSGLVSTENNGGFSSLRYRFESLKATGLNRLVIRVKGDGKRYQFRIKDKVENRHAFISYFKSTGEWQLVELSLSDMYPTFRGRRLEMANFCHDTIEEVAFLIGNGVNESFQLEIDYIKID